MATKKSEPTNPIDSSAVEKMNKALLDAKESVEALESSFEKQLKVVMQLRDAMQQVASITKEVSSSSTQGGFSTEMWEKLKGQISQTTNSQDKFLNSAQKTSGFLNSKYSSAFKIATAAISGLGQGFRNIFSLSKSVFGIMSSAVGAIFNFGKALISIPFRMIGGLFEMSKGATDTALAQAIEHVRAQFGSLSSESSRTVINVARNMGKLDYTGVSAYSVFGNLAERIEAVNKMATAMGATFQVFQKEIMANGEAIMRYNKGLGITDEMMNGIAYTALRMGTDIAQVQNEMTKQALGMSKAFGVNAKVISRDMAVAMKDLAHFGHLSTKEIAIAATFANKLGVSVDKLTGILDATKTFDNTAEQVSRLNEQFGTNIDAQQLMMEENPAAQMEILRKEFSRAGVDVSKLSRFQRELIKSTGFMSDEMLNASMSSKNASVSLDKMQRQGDKNEQMIMSQTQAMRALADSMERMIKTAQFAKGGLLSQIIEGFTRGIQMTPEFIRLMNNMNQTLQQAYQFGVKLGYKFGTLFPGIAKIFGGLADIFDPKTFSNMFDRVLSAFDIFKVKGAAGMNDFMDRLSSIFLGFFSSSGKGGSKVLEGIKEFYSTIFVVLTKLASWTIDGVKKLFNNFMNEMKNPGPTSKAIIENLSSVFNSVAEFIRTTLVPTTVSWIKSLTAWLKSDNKDWANAMPSGSEISKTLGQIFGPLGSALVEAAKTLWPVLRELALELVGKLINFMVTSLPQLIADAPWSVKLLLGFKLLGPVFSSTLSAGFSVLMQPAVFEGIMKQFATSTGKAVADGTLAGVESGVAQTASKAPGIMGRLGGVLKTVGTGGLWAAGITAAVGGALTIGSALGEGIRASQWAASGREKFEQETKDFQDALTGQKTAEEKLKLAKQRQEQMDKKLGGMTKGAAGFLRGMAQEFGLSKSEEQQTLELMKKAADEDVAKFEQLQKDTAAGLIKGTKEYDTRMAAEAQERRKAQVKEQLDLLGPITIDNAQERFKKIEELSKRVMSKDFDIGDKLKQVEEKLKGISFVVVPKEKEEEINNAMLQLKAIQSIMISIADIGNVTKVAGDRLGEMAKSFAASPFSKLEAKENPIQKLASKLVETFRYVNLDDLETITNKQVPVMTKVFESLKDMFTTIEKSVSGSDTLMSTSLNRVLTIRTSLYDTIGGVRNIRNMMDQFMAEDLVGDVAKYAMKIEQFFIAPLVQIGNQVSTKIATSGLTRALETISNMISKVNELNSTLANLTDLKFSARLKTLAENVGMGGSFNYEVKNKDVVINLKLDITMLAGEVERAILFRKQSIIRDRINYALGTGGADTVTPESLTLNEMTPLPVAKSIP